MKKLLVLAILVMFAGTTWADSPLYVKALPIAQITSVTQGYRVVYMTGSGDPQIVYVPVEWFYLSNGYRNDDGFAKAELHLGQDASYPYIQFFWKNGTFHHLAIYARSNDNDTTWGQSRPGQDFAKHFDPTKPLDLKF